MVDNLELVLDDTKTQTPKSVNVVFWLCWLTDLNSTIYRLSSVYPADKYGLNILNKQ